MLPRPSMTRTAGGLVARRSDDGLSSHLSNIPVFSEFQNASPNTTFLTEGYSCGVGNLTRGKLHFLGAVLAYLRHTQIGRRHTDAGKPVLKTAFLFYIAFHGKRTQLSTDPTRPTRRHHHTINAYLRHTYDPRQRHTYDSRVYSTMDTDSSSSTPPHVEVGSVSIWSIRYQYSKGTSCHRV